MIAETPNVVIKNPEIRVWLGGVLYGLSFIAGLASLVVIAFPELTHDSDVPMRAIALVNSIVSFTAGAFGIVVTTPNVPTALGKRHG